jgi:phenylpropionate dioxygenase-like ring-hydroxylating dioxygenase large terminal subunit
MAEADAGNIPSTSPVRRDYVPAADYSAEFHRKEMELLWPRVWQPACRLEEIPDVGDYVNYEIGNESILVLRSAPDTVRAFYNVCPHRGRRLRDDERGNLSLIFCGYHAWTFDLEGRPTAIPAREDWQGCPAVSDDDLSLGRVKADTWAGWVWINMDPESEPLHDFLQYIPEWLDVFKWEECRIRWYKTLIFPINWKVALEAFVEGYHSIGTHPQLMRFGDMYLPGFKEDLEGVGRRHGSHMGHQHYEYGPDKEYPTPRDWLIGQLSEVHKTLHGIVHDEGARAIERVKSEVPDTVTLEEAAVRYTEILKDEMHKAGIAYPEGITAQHMASTEWQIFPNTSILPSPEGAFWYRSRPSGDNPDSCIFDVLSLGRFAPGKEPDWTHDIYENLDDFKGQNPILEQDFSNMLAVHKGMRSRGFKGARPNPVQENNVYNIHRVLHGFMFGGTY